MEYHVTYGIKNVYLHAEIQRKMEAREYRRQKAHETLQIIEQGFYQMDNKQIDITRLIQQSIDRAQLYSPSTLNYI